MGFSTLKRVTIITEALIKDDIIKHIVSHGARGYTIDTVYGRGQTGKGLRGERGLRDDESLIGDHLRNVKIEVITSKEAAEKILSSVVEKFFKNYSGIIYMHDIEVVRAEKFAP